MARTIQIRALTDNEIAVIKAGLELLFLQGQKVTREAAGSMLEQQMPENFLWISRE